MKKYSLLGCLLLLVTLSYGQIRFGLKAGLVSSGLTQENLAILDQGGVTRLKLALEDGNYGINFGALVRIELGNTFLQPELNFQSNSADFTLDDLGQPGAPTDVLRESYQYLDIPVQLGFRLGPLRLQGGPQGHLFLNSTSDLFDFADYQQNFQDFTVGYVLGGGLDIWNLMIDLRYQGNLNRFGNHITFFGNQYEFSQRPSQWNLTVGWLFGGRK
jgi:hypothetical protein